jgi:hypothetical protein
LDRVGRLDAARVAADVLGIRHVLAEPDPNLYVDLTVRLGPEWTLPEPTPEGDAKARPWWDPRRFFRSVRPPATTESGNH